MWRKPFESKFSATGNPNLCTLSQIFQPKSLHITNNCGLGLLFVAQEVTNSTFARGLKTGETNDAHQFLSRGAGGDTPQAS